LELGRVLAGVALLEAKLKVLGLALQLVLVQPPT
jgi:hypothetical protein